MEHNLHRSVITKRWLCCLNSRIFLLANIFLSVYILITFFCFHASILSLIYPSMRRQAMHPQTQPSPGPHPTPLPQNMNNTPLSATKSRPKNYLIFFFKVTFCFWMMTTDKSNYGTPLSYAIENQDNEITFTDYSGFVFAVKGNIICARDNIRT